jgi:nitrogen-specific signal transduction histidine kinase
MRRLCVNLKTQISIAAADDGKRGDPDRAGSDRETSQGGDPLNLGHGQKGIKMLSRPLETRATEGSFGRAEISGEFLQPLTAHVVSDNPALRESLADLAASGAAGSISFTFSRPADGLEKLLAPGIDALVVDMGLGDNSDIAFLRRAIALGPDAPVIALCRDDPALQMTAMKAGAEDCLSVDERAPGTLALAIRRAAYRCRSRERHLSETIRPQAAPQVTLVQESSEAMVILDAHGIVRFANTAAEELLGRKMAEIIGKPFDLSSEPGEREVTVTRPDGDQRHAEIRIVDTRWGGVPARVAALTDVTVRRRLERTMQAAEAQSRETRMRSQSFFSNVNHDLRTPLTHIIGFSELMKDEHFGPMGTSRYREYARDIHSSGTMLLDMIEDLLGIAEAETDQINLTDEICNIGQLVEIAVASHKQGAGEEGVKIEIDCPPKLPGLRGDARRLRQGLFRLISEAIHGARRGVTLKLKIRAEDERLVLTLTEDGDEESEGSAQGALPYLPEDPFISTEDSGTARSESLALSLTRKVMELHGGTLDVSEGPAHRMAISLSFPGERLIR